MSTKYTSNAKSDEFMVKHAKTKPGVDLSKIVDMYDEEKILDGMGDDIVFETEEVT